AALLRRLVEGVPDRRRRRCSYLELGNDAIDASDVGIDGASLVATNRDRKRDVEKIPRNVVSEVADLLLRFRRRGRRVVRVRTGRFAVDHHAKYDASPLDRPCGCASSILLQTRRLHGRTEFAHPTPELAWGH